jgi:hypothetical protein
MIAKKIPLLIVRLSTLNVIIHTWCLDHQNQMSNLYLCLKLHPRHLIIISLVTSGHHLALDPSSHSLALATFQCYTHVLNNVVST